MRVQRSESFAAIILVVCCLAAVSAEPASGDTISTLSLWDGHSGIQNFGEPNNSTFGQTITVPTTASTLEEFRFFIDDFADYDPAIFTSATFDTVDFAAYVMKWDGAKATGPVLWKSQPQTTGKAGVGVMEEFVFTTGGLDLVGGAEYVLFVSASEFFDGISGAARMGLTFNNPGAYPGGRSAIGNTGADFSALTSVNWASQIVGGDDLAFSASFSVIPEPATLLLFALGAAGIVWVRRRRRNLT